MKKIFQLIMSLAILNVFIFAQEKVNSITLDVSNPEIVINKNIYGQFSEHLGHCIYGGIWVGENSTIPNTRGIRNDVAAALKELKVPVLRWPGGCFADEYHWMNGIGPIDKRAKMVNTNWGGVVEDNSFGTHEFLDLCEQIGCEPYFTGNVGSGTVQEMSDWVEYINSDGENPMSSLRKQNGREKPWHVKYWAIGNENWGCGGEMTPEFYADQYKRFSVFCRNYGDNKLFKIACGPAGDDYNWTEVLMKKVNHNSMQGLALHYYTVPKDWSDKGSATEFNEDEYFATVKKCIFIDTLIVKHSKIMDKYDPDKKIGLMVDEWGNWYNVEPGTNPGFLFQQNTLRDAITAATSLNIFNNHADRVRMGNIAQIVNVLQSVILTDGPKMVLTPTYYAFDLLKVHQNAKLVPMELKSADYVFGNDKVPAVNSSASIDESGKVHISLVNVNPNSDEKVICSLNKFDVKSVTGKIITSKKLNTYNSFDKPDEIKPAEFSDFKLTNGSIEINMPSKSVVVLELIRK